MNFFNRIGYELRKFMIGRYGIDNLGIILMVAGFVLSLFSRISIVISAISLLILGFGIFRMLSKKHSTEEEGEQFCNGSVFQEGSRIQIFQVSGLFSED